MAHKTFFRRFVTIASFSTLALSCTPGSLASDSPAFFAKVSGVVSGDTITLFDEKRVYTVRLYGVRCPRKDRPWGRDAREFVTQLVFGKTVEVRIVSEVPGDRSSAIIILEGQVVNEEVLKKGLAWVNAPVCRQPVCSKWTELESEAKAAKEGLWRESEAAQPWEGKRKGRPKGQPHN